MLNVSSTFNIKIFMIFGIKCSLRVHFENVKLYKAPDLVLCRISRKMISRKPYYRYINKTKHLYIYTECE